VNGIIGTKVGMTSIYNDNGKSIACTVVEANPNIVTQVKTSETDGYNAVQLGFGSKKEKNTSKALLGHFAKANAQPKQKLVEFRDFDIPVNLGNEISIGDIFEEGDFVNVIGITKGKGFQGVVKRHGFRGVNDATHGQHNRLRSPGSIGAASYPARVFKGMRMGGRTGGNRVKTRNLEIIKIIPERNLMLVKGAIAGHKGSFVIIEK